MKKALFSEKKDFSILEKYRKIKNKANEEISEPLEEIKANKHIN